MRIPYDVPMAAAIAYSLYATPGSGNPLPDVKDISDSPRLTQPYYPPAADCVEYTVPVSIKTDVIDLAFPDFHDDYILEDFLTLATTRAGADVPSPALGTKPFAGTYNISASFCTPKDTGAKAKTVLLATHGIGPGRQHWNLAFEPEQYNFVQHAIAEGYSVWFYDRLGCGHSQHILGNVNQINIESAVLQQLSTIVKSGLYTGNVGKPDKLAVMGFSFGSYITHAAVGVDPGIADAVVLTAIGLNKTGINVNGLARSFVPRVAKIQNAKRFGSLDDGWLTWVDKFALIENYFKRPYYNPATVDYVEATKEAFSIGEFLTFPSPNGGNYDASDFYGPVLAITGKEDYIVCDGECEGIFEEPARYFYRNAQPFVPYLHPNASHHINFHHNATGAFKVITGFLDEHLK